MTTQTVDASSLESWDDAFRNYQLPTIRRLEQQLRRNVDDNREKLRSLVGGSYRDLLGTAERIIEMDDQIQDVDSGLRIVGGKCNVKAVERNIENHERMKRGVRGSREEEGRKRTLAQTKVLQNTLAVTGEIVAAKNGGGDALLASKLLVLARLLHKSVSERQEPPAILENLRRRLAGLRRKLMAYIDKSLATSKQERDARIHTLCAYAMVTSSAPKDVLRHFLQVRYHRIESLCDSTPSEDQALSAYEAYSQTILDAREIFPRRFSDALGELGKAPLLQDKSFAAVPELCLDIYLQWLSDDVRTFTPWVRHDQLLSSTVSEGLSLWTKQAESAMLKGLEKHLETQTEALEVVAVRFRVLSKYLTIRSTLRQERQTTTSLQALRNIFLKRLEQLAVLSSEAPDLLEDIDFTFTGSSQASSIWDIAARDTDLSSGAMELRTLVTKQRYGRDKFIDSQIDSLEQWFALQESFWTCTKEIEAQKWDDDLDLEFGDDSDDSDEGSESESLQTMLSVQDSNHVRKKHHESVVNAIKTIYDKITGDSRSATAPALFVRLIRELDNIKQDVSILFDSIIDAKADQSFIKNLHENAADNVALARLSPFGRRFCGTGYTPTMLWDEANPPLPLQPSPTTYKLLKSIHAGMSDVGADFWSASAVECLKGRLDRELGSCLADTVLDIPGSTSPKVNGDASKEEGENEEADKTNGDLSIQEVAQAQLTQRLFDLIYLQHVLGRQSQDGAQGIGLLINKLLKHLEFGSVAKDRLIKSAGDHWNRTYLLFGLLAP
ncbi:hypothetical protein K431DRAFT_302908 [Polychaeton citri CBS 116435]|uniref:Conserved oligomeric Golgi complex subunit 1 n=1 Tax=Polychaeton citri CBS 116435 TaxID=1314669 RepID=A0A9P4QA82_9PEZI|nr:hypothetical protein K431DRAFT_302908 [Polychaeton citri CBS 116435]